MHILMINVSIIKSKLISQKMCIICTGPNTIHLPTCNVQNEVTDSYKMRFFQ